MKGFFLHAVRGDSTAHSMKFLRYAAVGALLLGMTTPSWAWGRAGHRLTALVAQDHLDPAAKAQVQELLGKETMADVAPWADGYRVSHPETGAWHFVDIPRADARFDRARDCPVSQTDATSPWHDCVTDRIMYFEGRLGDKSLSKDDRAFALKMLIHFVGDLHQPFHAIGDDRGGNGISVSFLGSKQCGSYKCNLHGVWDESIIDHEGLREDAFRAHLEKLITENGWEKMTGGGPTAWANVSHHYAVLMYAPNGALLTTDYVKQATKIVDAELALGGLRLARILNNILGDATPAASPALASAAAPAATTAPAADAEAPKK
ncbi:MAG: S1/P1 nuclease [Bryocella sp.]